MNIESFLAFNGFSVWDTGGGCTAYGVELANGRHVLLTGFEGLDHADVAEHDFLMGLRDSEGFDIAILSMADGDIESCFRSLKRWP